MKKSTLAAALSVFAMGATALLGTPGEARPGSSPSPEAEAPARAARA